jgi:hypothetical protein
MKKKAKKQKLKSKTIGNIKTDIMGGDSFTNVARPKKQHHISTFGQLPKDDENTFSLEENLIGMEYDLEPKQLRKWNEDTSGDWDEEKELDLDELI